LRTERKEQGESKVSLRLDHVAGRYMNDVGDHHAGEGAEITRGKVDRLVKYFGAEKELTAITHDEAVALKNWRRKHKVGKGENAKLISPFTVNDTTEQLKKLFTYVKERGVVLPKHAPNFRDPQLWLDEPDPRPRVLTDAEEDRLDASTAQVRPDYAPLLTFADLTGKRKTECIKLKKSQIKWERNVILIKAKRNKVQEIVITPSIRAVLWPLRDHPSEFVFTYVAQRTTQVMRKGGETEHLVEGQRYPITKDGLRRVWHDVRVDAGIPTSGEDRYRFHDKRHNFASRLLKSIPSADGIKIVQASLGHADIATTLNIYSHTDPETVAAATEALAQTKALRRSK
jgi:integrase